MKQTILLLVLFLSGTYSFHALSQENRIISRTLRQETQDISAVNDANSLTTMQYYDRAGRLVQTIQKGVVPGGGDLANYIVYDALGRKSKEYLNAPFPGNSGNFIPESEIKSAYPWYHTYAYDSSPLKRLKEVYGLHVATNKSVAYNYKLNTNSIPELSVYTFQWVENNEINKRFSAEGAYHVTETIDEDGNRGLIFTDDNNNTVMERRIDSGVFHDTYYIRDLLNRLRCVLPPSAADYFSSVGTVTLASGNVLDKYAYFYDYDNRNQCIGVKLPGTDWTYTVYDGDHRPILSQNGNQRRKNEWTFLKYDGMNRIVLEGSVKDSRNRETLAELFKNVLVRESFTGSITCKGYSDNIKLGQGTYSITSARYYDNYAFMSLEEFRDLNTSLVPPAKGLLTGTFEAVLNVPGKGKFTAYMYDNKGRIQQQLDLNNLFDHRKTLQWVYNFYGSVIGSYSSYDENYSLLIGYVYDQAERETNALYSTRVNGTIGTAQALRNLVYDDYGRVSTKKLLNGKTELQYNYTTNGTLVGINSSNIFNETLYRGGTTLPYSLPRCYNGNVNDISISQQGKLYFYHCSYDGLDRLKSGVMYDVSGRHLKLDEYYEYDKMGNIVSLLRTNEGGGVNSLEMSYDGNHLVKVTDHTPATPTYDLALYPDKADQAREYYYDAAGNETANLDKEIVAVRYNRLNLPDTVQFANGNRIVNYYLANGEKLGSVSRTYTTPLSVPLDKVTNSPDPYLETSEQNNGDLVYRNGTVDRLLYPDGYFELEGTTFKPNVYICDHLGSIRLVCDGATGNVLQSLEYYPSGLIFRSKSYDMQPYKFGGKKLLAMHGLNQYDSKARMQEFQIPRFTSVDPLCEKYYSVSPYAYCNNNPVNLVDPDGKEYGPGDLFFSELDAAIDFGQTYNGISIIKDQEMASIIYTISDNDKLNGFSYTEPSAGGKHSTEVSSKGMNKKNEPSAIIHTHGAYSEKYKNNDFSKTDISTLSRNKLNGFLVSPDGGLRMYEKNKKETFLLQNNMPSDPQDPKRLNNVSPSTSAPIYKTPSSLVDSKIQIK